MSKFKPGDYIQALYTTHEEATGKPKEVYKVVSYANWPGKQGRTKLKDRVYFIWTDGSGNYGYDYENDHELADTYINQQKIKKLLKVKE